MAKSKKASQVPKQISQQRKASVETKAAIASIVQEPAPVVQEPTPVVQEPAIALTPRRRSQRRQTFAEKLESVITEEQAPVVQEPIALTPTPKRTSQRKQTVAEKPASVITEEQAPAVADEPVQMAEDPVPIAEEPVVEAPQVEFVSRNPELVQKPRMSAAKKAGKTRSTRGSRHFNNLLLLHFHFNFIGIIFPPTRMRKALKSKGYGNKVYRTAGVYAAAAIEYLVAEILELASNVARDHHVVRITPRHIMLAIRHDDELNQLIGPKTVLAKSGVVPNIHSVLLPKTK